MGNSRRGSPWADLDHLVQLAEMFSGAWSARGRASTTSGQERALLRLLGVHGLDQAGRPLAAEVVDRYVLSRPDRLAGGIVLPFSMALLEYDLAPQQLALDVASGAVDLALEAELLAEPDRRAVAEAHAARLVATALDRIDANRTARLELVAMLGDPPRPWVATTILEPAVDEALGEAERHARSGLDVLRVEVPVGRELTRRLHDAGLEVLGWMPPDSGLAAASGAAEEIAPSGSQRGLGTLRRALDEIAAERHSYVRMATAAPALGTPEQAVVAAFERIDVVEADLVAEIVSGSVDPDRAVADHSFAHRLLIRSGTHMVVGAGPLVVGPDLEAGVPSAPATRAGRALALQLVGVAVARANGMPVEQIIVGSIPDWLIDERTPAARAAGEVALRRALFGGHPLAFEEPPGSAASRVLWRLILAGVLPPEAALVVRHPVDGSLADIVAETRAIAEVSAELRGAVPARDLEGAAAEHVAETVRAAISTIRQLAESGWRAILGDRPGTERHAAMGADAVVERTEAFDPLGATDQMPV